MKRVLTVCIIIIILVITSDIFIKRKIFDSFDYMTSMLNAINEEIDVEKKNKQIEQLNMYLKNKYLLMAFYIDHVEIEKIKTQIVVIEAGIEKEDDDFVHEEIKRTIFIIDHLKAKIDFKLENIL
ncbi:MAG: DUF4363 family protein [Clostridia bacterium]|nr:DUF4363 family protein [Clostridia bacterium]